MFFIHIPKTAGSSFRKSAEAYYGVTRMLYDYGVDTKETSDAVKQLEYRAQPDRFALANHARKHAAMLAGHVSYVKYAPFFHAKDVLTFVREPAQQIRSHYEHYVRHHGYKKSFMYFIGEKRFCNLQSRYLLGLPLSAIGFVGITERFDESLKLINSQFNTEFKSIKINNNTAKQSDDYVISTDELQAIIEHNADDIALYVAACERFESQKRALNARLPFVRFGLLHVPQREVRHKIKGWVVDYENSAPQTLNVLINGNKVAELSASEYVPMAKERNMGRDGFIGFTYTLPKNVKPGDELRLVDAFDRLLYHRTITN